MQGHDSASSRRYGRAFRATAAGASLVACVLLLGGNAARAADGWRLIDGDKVGGYHWRAEVSSRGEYAICMEVSVFGRERDERSGVGQCSAPSPRRGIVLAAVEPEYRSGRPKVTAVAAAFSRSVARVEVTLVNGATESLHLRTIRGAKAVSRYRYAAFGRPGPWCVARLRTFDDRGRVLWSVGWRELSMEASELPYSPRLVC